MIARLSAILISGFWLIMMLLLIQTEYFPDDSNLQEVPPRHVLNVLFTHQQHSHVGIFQGQQRVGHLAMRPFVRREPGMTEDSRILEVLGNLQIQLPLAQQSTRLFWNARIGMTPAMQVDTVQMEISTTEPPVSLTVQLDPGQETPVFRVLYGNMVVREERRPLREILAGEELSKLLPFGMPFLELEQSPAESGADATVVARLSQIQLGGERISTYRISMSHGEAGESYLHLSQLGQLLYGHSILGYSMRAEYVDVNDTTAPTTILVLPQDDPEEQPDRAAEEDMPTE